MLSALQAVKVSPLIEKVNDHKDFKKLLRTRTNVLALYTKSGQSSSSHRRTIMLSLVAIINFTMSMDVCFIALQTHIIPYKCMVSVYILNKRSYSNISQLSRGAIELHS